MGACDAALDPRHGVGLNGEGGKSELYTAFPPKNYVNVLINNVLYRLHVETIIVLISWVNEVYY